MRDSLLVPLTQSSAFIARFPSACNNRIFKKKSEHDTNNDSLSIIIVPAFTDDRSLRTIDSNIFIIRFFTKALDG